MWKTLIFCCGLFMVHASAAACATSTADATLSTINAATVIPPVRQTASEQRRQILCLALGLYHEARGETLAGQQAVGDVILNRIRDTGASICQTLWEKGQFSWTDRPAYHLQPRDITAWQTVQHTAINLVSHRTLNDPTGGATYFYNVRLCHPRWARHGVITARIGDHVFIRPISSLW